MTSFTSFSCLPTELRLKIWNLNLPNPRVVPIHYTCASSDSTSPMSRDAIMSGCTSNAKIPANLHTNRESRYEALTSYELSFNLQHSQAKTFFNPAVDILYFGPKDTHLDSFKNFLTAATMIAPSGRNKVQKLAVHEDLFCPSEENISSARITDFWEIIKGTFKNIRQVVVVTRDRGTRHCRLRWCNLVAEVQYGLDEVEAQSGMWEVPVWDIVALAERGHDIRLSDWDIFPHTQKCEDSRLPEWPFGWWTMKLEQYKPCKE